jgi:hypothetical protein
MSAEESHKGSAGVRSCASCGSRWRSTYGALKDMGAFGPQAQVTKAYDPAQLVGLTCPRCHRSFCKECLGGSIPLSLPGGSCPSCGGKLDLA